MGMSGSVTARCKVCGCAYIWSFDNHPFVDSEIIGTCDNCLHMKNHDIYDEGVTTKNGCPYVAGQIVFTERGHHFEINGKRVKKKEVMKAIFG